MKSKKLTILLASLAAILFICIFWIYRNSQNPLTGVLRKEWIEQRFPEKVDTEDSNWQVLPYGYTLGPWPIRFQGEPIVSKLTYHRGPPQKFIQSVTQLWKPVEAELTLLGPKTLVPGMKQSEWKECFESRFSCNSPREKVMMYLNHRQDEAKIESVTWFDHLDAQGPRGLHVLWDYPKYRIDDFVVLTENGIAQGFELKTVKSDAGDEARALLYQAFGSLKVKEDLTAHREWIQTKLHSVNLAQIQKIQDAKLRLTKLIETQTWLFSLLSVSPTDVAPFFHLSGVTHLFVLDLIKLKTTYFESQESWILAAKPNLDTLLKYTQDFDRPEVPKQIEALIQDVLLQQQQKSGIR